MIKKYALLSLIILSTSNLWAAEAEYKQKAEAAVGAPGGPGFPTEIISQEEIEKQSTPNGCLVAALMPKEIILPNKTKIHTIDIAGAQKALGKSANPDAEFENGVNVKSILFYSVEKEQIEAVKLLIAHGADVNKRNNVGTTPLMIAASIDTSFVELLLKHNADVNAIKSNVGTAINFTGAATKYPEKNIALLLAHRADINHCWNTAGRETVLHRAVAHGQFEFATYLLHAKANPLIENWEGTNVCDLVSESYIGRSLYPHRYEGREKELIAFKKSLLEKLEKEIAKL